MLFLGLALLSAVIGSLPYLLSKRVKAFVISSVCFTLVLWLIYYVGVPSLVFPLWGAVGVFTTILLIITAIVDGKIEAEEGEWQFTYASWPAIIVVVLFMLRGCSGCSVFRSEDYSQLIGDVETREWTLDVQPKNPEHVRLVPEDLASWLANKQLGEATGAIGSQYFVDVDHEMLQIINGELWYIFPLDFRGFNVWLSEKSAPGYIMVHGEDPFHQVQVRADYHFKYTPGACFGNRLDRYLWTHGYNNVGLTDFSLEIDDSGRPWWVVTLYEPTIAWFGDKVTGVVLVDPESGEITPYRLGESPAWVDRVIPGIFVKDYVKYRGGYHLGWWNHFWVNKDLTEPEQPRISYGYDGEPYWVTSITSVSSKKSNTNDESMIGLYYTDTRTGQSIFYQAVGGTEYSIIQAVNNKVGYRNWHGCSPVMYNINGVMTSIVPLLGEQNTFQGVAFVRVDNLEVAYGTDQYGALREYQKLLSRSGQEITPENIHEAQEILARVWRIGAEVSDGQTSYSLCVKGVEMIFTAGPDISPKLSLTDPGDSVRVLYINGEQGVVPMLMFDNLDIPIQISQSQQNVRQRVAERKEVVSDHLEGTAARDKLQQLSDEEARELLEKYEQEEQESK